MFTWIPTHNKPPHAVKASAADSDLRLGSLTNSQVKSGQTKRAAGLSQETCVPATYTGTNFMHVEQV